MDYLDMTLKDFLANPPKKEDDIPRKERASIILATLNGLEAATAHWILNTCKGAVLRQSVVKVDLDYAKEHLLI